MSSTKPNPFFRHGTIAVTPSAMMAEEPMQLPRWDIHEWMISGALIGLAFALLLLTISSEWEAFGWLLGGTCLGCLLGGVIGHFFLARRPDR
jgi:hypothetical protein